MMQKILAFLKTSLLGGALVVLPAWLAVLLISDADGREHLHHSRGQGSPVDVAVTPIFKCISKWGTGAGELFAFLPRLSPTNKPGI